jgi:hypothetical protein
MKTIAREPRWRFFAKNAGYSYKPGESKQKARNENGRTLANAEARAKELGWEVLWEEDGELYGWQEGNVECFDVISNPENFEGEKFPAWSAILYGPEIDEDARCGQCGARRKREVLGSLGGCTFADGGDPWSDDYHEIVEAELASEALYDLDSKAQASS